MNAALRAILFVVLGLALALTFLLPLAMGQPLPGQPGGGREATKTPVAIDPSPTPSATPVARAFAPVVFEEARTPTPEVSKTPPPDGPSPTPSATPRSRSYAPAVFDVARTPTPVLTKTPPPERP